VKHGNFAPCTGLICYIFGR